MRSIKKSPPKNARIKKIIIATAITVVLLAGAALLYAKTRHTPTTNTSTQKSSSSTNANSQSNTTGTNSQTTPPSAKGSTVQKTPGVSSDQTTNQVPVSQTSSISITSLNETSGNVNIAVAITNPASSGVCTFTFTKTGARPVTHTVNTTTSACSASIPSLEFSMVGDWQVEADYFANNTQTTTTGTVTVQ